MKINILLSYILDFLHILYFFLPFAIFFIPIKYFWLTKIIILLLLLTPVHWGLFDGCILSIISEKLGSIKASDYKYNNPFLEKYFSWPINMFFKIIGKENTKKTLDKVVAIQWIIVYLIIYYYIFYFMKCRPKKISLKKK